MNVLVLVLIGIVIYVLGVITSSAARRFAVFAVTDVKADFEKEKAILKAELVGLETKVNFIEADGEAKLQSLKTSLEADKAKLAADLKAALAKVELLKSLFPSPAPVDSIPSTTTTVDTSPTTGIQPLPTSLTT